MNRQKPMMAKDLGSELQNPTSLIYPNSCHLYGEPDDALYGIWAGDMDGDGVADILMGSRNKNEKEGAVYLVSSDASQVWLLKRHFGLGPFQAITELIVIAQIGDVDADGLDDVVMNLLTSIMVTTHVAVYFYYAGQTWVCNQTQQQGHG